MGKVSISTTDLKNALLGGGLSDMQYLIANGVGERAEEMFEEALAHWGEANRSLSRGEVGGSKEPQKTITKKSDEVIETEVAVYNDILYFVSEGTKINWTRPVGNYSGSSRFGTYKWGGRVGDVQFTTTPNSGIRGRALDTSIVNALRDEMNELILQSLRSPGGLK